MPLWNTPRAAWWRLELPAKILFDQGTPLPLRDCLVEHDVRTAHEEEWSRLNPVTAKFDEVGTDRWAVRHCLRSGRPGGPSLPQFQFTLGRGGLAAIGADVFGCLRDLLTLLIRFPIEILQLKLHPAV